MHRSNSGDFPDAKILVIDDEEPNLKLARQVLMLAGYVDVRILQDSRKAVETITGDEPDLVLLDVHMPYFDGYEILEKVAKLLSPDAFVPILMCTSDNGIETRQRALSLGANDFIVKPFEKTEMLLRVRNFLRMRYLHLQVQQANATLENRVRVRTQELVESRGEAFYCLARALELRDDSDNGHMKRVANLSEHIARAMGLEDAEVEMIGLIAPLHDLGKIAVKEGVGERADEDQAALQRHTLMGEAIIGKCNSPMLRELRDLAAHHHEKWDGTGYPHGLKGEEIPITCRIVAIADMFDGLVRKRTEVPPLTREEALAEIHRLSGSYFDPAVVDVFLKMYVN